MESESVSFSISQPFSGESNNNYIITVTNNLGVTAHKRLYLLLDISGSMSGERISLVVHACKAIIKACDETIEIAIFVFGSTCVQITELLPMTDENKVIFLDTVSRINTDGCTNLIEGLSTTLSYIRSKPSSIDTHCIVFTDGEPDNKNISAYQSLLNTYLDDANFNCIIDVFGFGTSLNMEILKTIFLSGKGIFAFISDKNMMATIFNNYIANLFSTTIINAKLSFEIEDEITGEIDFGIIEIANIQSLQIKDFIVSISKDKKLGYATLKFTNLLTNSNKSQSYESIPVLEIDVSKYFLNKFRSELINIDILANINNDARTKLGLLYEKYTQLLSNLDNNDDSKEIQTLLIDIISPDPMKGQIMKAIDSYTSWGNKYLISLMQAHIAQITINFKDQSLQSYSGIIAKSKLDKLNADFNSIVYVSIDASYGTTYGASYGTTTSVSSQSAASFNDRYAGCFCGESLLSIIDNYDNLKTISLKELKSGDRIQCEKNDSTIIVQYIMKTAYKRQTMFRKGELIGTSKHPIIDTHGKWIHMEESYGATVVNEYNGNYLYSISATETFTDGTTKNVSSIILNGIQCAIFGHGDLDKDISNPKYSILSSTFWGQTILSIFEKLKQKRILQDNVLTLNNNYRYIRNNNGWCVGMEINGVEYN
jgi:uncharacterized protein YegL